MEKLFELTTMETRARQAHEPYEVHLMHRRLPLTVIYQHPGFVYLFAADRIEREAALNLLTREFNYREEMSMPGGFGRKENQMTEVTLDIVLDDLRAQYMGLMANPAYAQTPWVIPLPHDFIGAKDLADYQEAAAWWPKGCPPMLAIPSISALCAGYAQWEKGKTFGERLSRAAYDVSQWQQHQDSLAAQAQAQAGAGHAAWAVVAGQTMATAQSGPMLVGEPKTLIETFEPPVEPAPAEPEAVPAGDVSDVQAAWNHVLAMQAGRKAAMEATKLEWDGIVEEAKAAHAAAKQAKAAAKREAV